VHYSTNALTFTYQMEHMEQDVNNKGSKFMYIITSKFLKNLLLKW
jgi:hypothetical protein